MKKVEVVAGIVFHQDSILCVQRPKNKLPYISEKFEFPGGKIEEGESPELALKRELREELSIEVAIKSFFYTVVHPYPDFELTMHSYICEVETKDLTLHEHISYQWLKPTELAHLDWAGADVPIVSKLMQNGQSF